jgi:hypothetical protein
MQTLGSSPAPDGGDFSREKAAILKSAPRGKDGHPLAPNGKRSNLTEDQWAAVRTGNFKKWFGDWEALRVQDQIAGMRPVFVAIPDEWRGRSVNDMRLLMASKLDGMVKAKAIMSHPVLGEVKVGRRGANKTVSNSSDPAKMLITADLESIFPRSILAGFRPSDEQSVDGYSKLLVPLSLDGLELVAIFSVRHQTDGSWYYNSVAVEGQKERPGSYVSPGALPRPLGQTPITGLQDFIRQPLSTVNSETVSKIVDENGEPRAVFHGTASEFDTFDKNATKLYWDDEHGFFFETSETFAKDYADAAEVMLYQSGANRNAKGRIISAFLDIKNPMEEDFTGEYETPAEWIDQHFDTNYASDIKARGHDGAVFTSNGETVIVAFEPNQIKSATDNSGGFSRGNPSTLSSPPRPRAILRRARSTRQDATNLTVSCWRPIDRSWMPSECGMEKT